MSDVSQWKNGKRNVVPELSNNLIGMQLDGGWTVLRKAKRDEEATGGCYSDCYIVQREDGSEAFMKGIDYSHAMRSSDPARALQELTASFNFERDLLAMCNTRRLRHVVVAIGSGTVKTSGLPLQYLLFELAESDVRPFSVLGDRFDPVWSLRTLHHVANGLRQLHGVGAAHQDLKPSNVLVFAQSLRKLADLGRAAWQGQTPPHHDEHVPGDQVYAPPELLYRDIPSDWNQRRFGCDAYLLGSLVMYFFMGDPMTAELFTELDESMNWMRWSGTYREVLPYVRDAFNSILERFSSTVAPANFRSKFGVDVSHEWSSRLTTIVRELSEPDPRLRGHPRQRKMIGNPYNLEPYVSQFDLLARQIEYRSR